MECVENRILWLHGIAVAHMPTNEARRTFLHSLPAAAAKQVRAIAIHELRQEAA